MNVVILHCHFERGGVTQVVENQVRALSRAANVQRIVLVSGPRVSGLSSDTTSVVEQLTLNDFDYDDPAIAGGAAIERGQRIASELQSLFSTAGLESDNTVLHWHNHSLGKNTAAPAAIAALARSNWRLLLQIHDFSEDNRPANYRDLITAIEASCPQELDAYLYPCASHIHYAGLTCADANVITTLGIPQSRTHCLPNSVVPPSAATVDGEASLAKVRTANGLPDDARWCLYPVRGIRRKNVGEFVLLCRWLPEEMFGGLTLCPATPVERRSYERWRAIAQEVSQRTVFDAAHHDGISFAENLAAADFVVSTSVAEGFGMAFLEPWLAERRVIARRLPTVTDDFAASGVQLSHLYDQIRIPGDREWLRACRAEIASAYDNAWHALPDEFTPAMDELDADESAHIDFARLTPNRQIEVLRRVAKDPGFEREVQALSQDVVDNLHAASDGELVAQNKMTIQAKYAPAVCGDMLLSVYQSLIDTQSSDLTTPDHSVSAVELVSRVRPFFPCRTESINE